MIHSVGIHLPQNIGLPMPIMHARVSALLIYLMGTVACAKDGTDVTYELPKDGKAVVFVYDEQNGFTPPRQNDSPMLTIRANGTIEMPTLYGQGRDVNGKISQQELQDFLRFVIEENRFFEFDPATVQSEIQEARLKRQIPQIADAPDNVFEIRLANRKHNVRQYAVGTASQYKEIEALQQLWAIQRRIFHLRSETRVGGKQGIKSLLKQANAELKKLYPNINPFTDDEFGGSYIRDNGIISATFSRSGKTKDGQPNGT